MAYMEKNTEFVASLSVLFSVHVAICIGAANQYRLWSLMLLLFYLRCLAVPSNWLPAYFLTKFCIHLFSLSPFQAC
jgi:ABC-type dipeptide/oligopeptide/nickel transport system permease component